jgi:hypothetical protein
MDHIPKRKEPYMAKRHGARNDIGFTTFVGPDGDVIQFYGYVGRPKGLPRSSTVAGAEDNGRKTGGRSWHFNPKGLTIGVQFPAPAPGSFWAPDEKTGWKGVEHDDFVEMAHEERRLEREEKRKRKAALKARKQKFRATLVARAKDKARDEGLDFDTALGLVAAEHEYLVRVLGTKLPKGAIQVFKYHTKEHPIQGVRRPVPLDQRLPEPKIGRSATGVSPMAQKSARFANDGLTEKQTRDGFRTPDGDAINMTDHAWMSMVAMDAGRPLPKLSVPVFESHMAKAADAIAEGLQALEVMSL